MTYYFLLESRDKRNGNRHVHLIIFVHLDHHLIKSWYTILWSSLLKLQLYEISVPGLFLSSLCISPPPKKKSKLISYD